MRQQKSRGQPGRRPRRASLDAAAPYHGNRHAETQRPPPYLRRSTNRLKSAWTRDRTLWLCIGPTAWHEARRRESFQLVAALPPGDDPGIYDWTLAAIFPPPVVLVWTGEQGDGDLLADTLARVLIAAGVRRVLGDHRIGDGLGDLWRAREAAHAA